MTSNLIWILYRSDSHSAHKETLNCKKIIESYGRKVLISEISIDKNWPDYRQKQAFFSFFSKVINNVSASCTGLFTFNDHIDCF